MSANSNQFSQKATVSVDLDLTPENSKKKSGTKQNVLHKPSFPGNLAKIHLNSLST